MTSRVKSSSRVRLKGSPHRVLAFPNRSSRYPAAEQPGVAGAVEVDCEGEVDRPFEESRVPAETAGELSPPVFRQGCWSPRAHFVAGAERGKPQWLRPPMVASSIRDPVYLSSKHPCGVDFIGLFRVCPGQKPSACDCCVHRTCHRPAPAGHGWWCEKGGSGPVHGTHRLKRR